TPELSSMDPSPVDTRERFETPESIWLEMDLAGPTARGFAFLADFILRWFVALVSFNLLSNLLGFSEDGTGLAVGVLLLLIFLFEWCYGWFFEAFWGGRTPGKRFFGMRVVRVGGYPLGFRDAMF